jgi:signal peptidase
MEITPEPHPTPALSRGRVVGALLVLGPVIVLVFLPTVLGLQRYVVADDSMAGDREGSIGRGAVALTRDVPATDLRAGDVISFRPPVAAGTRSGETVTRRIVSIEGGVAVTRGDHNDQDDPWQLDVTRDTYPRVVTAVPWIGYPFSGDAGRGGWVVLTTLSAVMLFLAVLGPVRRSLGGRSEARWAT